MSFIRNLPLKYRLPLIHNSLWLIAALKSLHWPKADVHDVVPSGDLVVSAFFKESLGIGRAGRLNATAFEMAGLEVIEHDIRPSFSRFVKGGLSLPGKNGVWLIHANAPEAMVALMAHPVEDWKKRYRICFWVWETPLIPSMWLWSADYFHEIWVPSQFVFEAAERSFKRTGKTHLIARLRLMPYPLSDLNDVKPSPASFGLEAGHKHFLCLFDAHSSAERKNPWDVLEAWRIAFPTPDTKARLTLKIQNLDNDPKTRHRLEAIMAGRDDIRLFQQRLSDDDMMAFVASFDVLISLHRSEGFGLPLAEAMATGVEVIATGYSGNLQFMNDENAALVPWVAVPIHDPYGNYANVSGRKDQVWAQPDLEIAAQLIKAQALNPEKHSERLAKAKMATTRLNDKWKREALSALPFTNHIHRDRPQLSE